MPEPSGLEILCVSLFERRNDDVVPPLGNELLLRVLHCSRPDSGCEVIDSLRVQLGLEFFRPLALHLELDLGTALAICQARDLGSFESLLEVDHGGVDSPGPRQLSEVVLPVHVDDGYRGVFIGSLAFLHAFVHGFCWGVSATFSTQVEEVMTKPPFVFIDTSLEEDKDAPDVILHVKTGSRCEDIFRLAHVGDVALPLNQPCVQAVLGCLFVGRQAFPLVDKDLGFWANPYSTIRWLIHKHFIFLVVFQGDCFFGGSWCSRTMSNWSSFLDDLLGRDFLFLVCWLVVGGLCQRGSGQHGSLHPGPVHHGLSLQLLVRSLHCPHHHLGI